MQFFFVSGLGREQEIKYPILFRQRVSVATPLVTAKRTSTRSARRSGTAGRAAWRSSPRPGSCLSATRRESYRCGGRRRARTRRSLLSGTIMPSWSTDRITGERLSLKHDICHPQYFRTLVYDLDSELPFPTYFHKYVTETFRTDAILNPEYHRQFRTVPAETFLQQFASDRRHMRKGSTYT